jgi:hypothetical protein
MKTSRRYWFVGMVVAAASLVPAAIAWACVAVVALTASPQSVQPGGSVAVTGRDFAPGAPIEIHLDSPTGRLLATQPAHKNSVMMNSWTLNVPIPADVSKGQHVLVATEDYHNMNGGVPARATIFVGESVAAPAPSPARPAGVPVSSGPSAASLILIGLGAAAVALLVAGMWSLAASRRSPQPEARSSSVS